MPCRCSCAGTLHAKRKRAADSAVDASKQQANASVAVPSGANAKPGAVAHQPNLSQADKMPRVATATAAEGHQPQEQGLGEGPGPAKKLKQARNSRKGEKEQTPLHTYRYLCASNWLLNIPCCNLHTQEVVSIYTVFLVCLFLELIRPGLPKGLKPPPIAFHPYCSTPIADELALSKAVGILRR